MLVCGLMKFIQSVAFSLLLLALLSCFQGTGFSGITVQLSSEPVSLDPSFAEDGMSLRVLYNTMDGLFGYDGTGKLESRLAESYEVSESRTKYIFKLKKAVWSDGEIVRPEHFVAGIRRSLAPETPSKLASLLYPIKGARSFKSGKADRSKLGVFSSGNLLVIELEKPVSHLLDILTLPVALPSRQELLDQSNNQWKEQNPVTGAYRITEHKPDQEIILEPNARYWGKKGEAAIRYRIVHDESTAVSLFERGEIDILTKVPSLDLKRLSEKTLTRTDVFCATYFLSFNTRKPPFDNLHMRRAVSGAIDREEIVQALAGGEVPAGSWIPLGLKGFERYKNREKSFTASIMEAKKNVVRDTVYAAYDSSSRNSLVMEKIEQDLRKKLGLKLTLQHMDWKSYVKALSSDAPQIFRFGAQAPFMDPIFHLEFFTSSDPNNYTGWSNKAYDELVKKIASIESGTERDKKIKQAQDILVEKEAVVVPVYHYVQIHAIGKRVKGFKVNPLGAIPFNELLIQ